MVVGFVAGDHVVGAEIPFGVEAGALAHFAAAVFARQNVECVATSGFDVAGFQSSAGSLVWAMPTWPRTMVVRVNRGILIFMVRFV